MKSALLHDPHPAEGVSIPDYLEPHDLPWLRALLEAFERFEGRPRRELDRHLREPLRCPSPKPKREAAARVLYGLCRDQVAPPVSPRKLRAALFSAAAAEAAADPARLRTEIAANFGLTPQDVDDILFADLPAERPVTRLPADLSPSELAARTNLAIAQGILRRASEVVVELRGNSRAVVRVARIRGLIVVARAAPPFADCDVRLSISGPLALFRKTVVYGRALASLLPALSWCDRFCLHARCGVGVRAHVYEIRKGDPIAPGDEPRAYDSRLEARFARDFKKAAPDWDLVREPEPVAVGDRLIFPDFALEHRRDRRRVLLEIVGFWTPQYLDHKLDALRRAELDDLIICIDAERNCGADDLPARARVLRYRKRIDPRAVLTLIEGDALAADP